MFTIRPVGGGFEMDGPAGVVRLADDDKFNDRLLVAVGEAGGGSEFLTRAEHRIHVVEWRRRA